MAASDLLFRPAHELAALIRDGELSARELVELSLRRIEELNPKLNAFIDIYAEDALAEADKVRPGDERPFAGVPVAIKNNRAVKGKRLTYSAAMLGDYVADHDSNVAARLKAAGFIVVGSTNLPEWGIMPTTEGARFGPARNPWDLERTPGGSSGGSAAAVAAGLVPLAHANDGGGSTRIPAACCGLVGLKPQRGRISTAPETGGVFLVQDGVLTRTVRETAELLDVLAGPVAGDAWWAPEPDEPFAVQARREPGRLRIAVTTTPALVDAEVDPEVLAATREAAELLASLGHEVVEADPPWRRPELLRLFTASFGPAVCTQIAWAATIIGREPTAEDMEPLSWALWNMCRDINSVEALGAEFILQGFARAIVQWMEPYDALLTPALAEKPLPLGIMSPLNREDPMAGFRRSAYFTPFTSPFNVSGQPAVSLPITQSEGGLPLAIQLVGKPAGEGPLLALAAQVEAARPWAGRRPDL